MPILPIIHRSGLIVLLMATAIAGAEPKPLVVKTDRFEARFAKGSLIGLADAAGHVLASAPAAFNGLGIHRIDTAHWATSDVADAPAGQGAMVRQLGQFSDLPGAAGRSELQVDKASGDLIVRQQCTSSAKGVWGVSWSIEGIPLDYAILIPGGSGLRLTATTPGRRHEFDYPIGWEAQLVIVEGKGHGLYAWADDAKGRFKRLIVERTAEGWRLRLVTINFAPFDKLTGCESVAWRVNTYEGDWRVPARRYRQWAETSFAPVMIERQHPDWVKEIRGCVIMGLDRNELQALPGRVDPKQTLLYLPDWRTAGYDRDYPTYDKPVAELRPFVELAHKLGFRVMLHVNYFGCDPLNPRYKEFEPYQVRSPWGRHEKEWWLWTRAEPEIRFAYINPAHKPWRECFVKAMVELCGNYGIDGLHLDQTLCIYNDHNGPIGGMSMIEGNVALHRDLRAALPAVALSGEGLNEVTYRYEAFAQRHAWGINHADGTWDRRWVAMAHPISSYLLRPYTMIYGYLGYAPPTEGQMYAAWNDAYQYWGVIPTLKPDLGQLRKPSGFSRQLFDEMAFWQGQRLALDLEGPWPSDVAFPYRTADGRAAARTADRRLVCGRQEISRTISDVEQIEAPGTIPGWLAYDEKRLLGLDPQSWYPHFPDPRDPAAFHVTELPPDLTIDGVCQWQGAAMVRARSANTVVVDLAAALDRATCGSRPFEGAPSGLTGPQQFADGAQFVADGTVISAHPPWKARRTDPATGRLAQDGSGVAFARYAIDLPRNGRLQFLSEAALDPGAIGPEKSDGVTFGVVARADGRELRTELHSATDRRQPLALDLTPLAGHRATVELTVHPGPKRSPGFDWARWHQPRIERRAETQGTVAVTGPIRWAMALTTDGAAPIQTVGSQQRVRIRLPGAVCFLQDSPQPVTLPVDLVQHPRQVVLLGNNGQVLASSLYAAIQPARNTVAGVVRKGLFAHPPNHGRIVAHYAMTLPAAPAALKSWVGLRDGSRSDGVLFLVEVNGREVARRRMLPGAWESLSADLAAWAGKPVILSLVTDSDGSFTCDWACWGEPRIEKP